MKKCLIISLSIFILLTTIIANTLLAITITEESLESSFKKLMEESKNNSDNTDIIDNSVAMDIDKNKKQITFSYDNFKTLVNYELSGNPTFSIETKVDNTTTYDEWEANEENSSSSLMTLYILICDLYGISFSDSSAYLFMTLFNSTSYNKSTKYYILDNRKSDTNGITYIGGVSDSKTKILASEFQNYAVEYAKNLYSPETIITDEKSHNTYKYTINIQETSDNSCTIKYTLTINPNGDFSKISGSADELQSSFENMFGNALVNSSINTNDQQQNVNNVISSINKLPQTGNFLNAPHILYIIMVLASISLIIIIIKNIRYKNTDTK